MGTPGAFIKTSSALKRNQPVTEAAGSPHFFAQEQTLVSRATLRGTGVSCPFPPTCYKCGQEEEHLWIEGLLPSQGLLPQPGLSRDLSGSSSQSRGTSVAHMFHLVSTIGFRQALATLLWRVLSP